MRPDRFGPPRIPASVVARPRLTELLGRRFAVRVVTVEGAAGFGKTTLLAQAVADNAQRPVGVDFWLTCEPADSDAERLGRALTEALGEPHGSVEPEGIADVVVRRSPMPVAIVIDDLHLVPHGSPGARLITDLLQALPDNGHLVLAGRAPLPVSTTRLIAQGRCLTVGEDALRLTEPELVAIAREHGLRDDALDASGGWPALAALGAAAGADAARRFVLEEVFTTLDGRSRESLAALCLIDGGDDELVGPGLGRPVALDRELAGVPLVARHGDGWFRPHALWFPIVDGALDDVTARAVRRAAARERYRRRDLTGALDLILTPTLDDADWLVVRDLVADACQIGSWVHTGAQAAGWYGRLPPERHDEPTALLLAAASERFRRGDGAATEPFERALAAAREAEDVPTELAALSQLGHLAWWRDDLAAGVEICARADELARAGWPLAETIAGFGHAMLAEIAGDPAAALRAAAAIDRGALSDLLAAAADWLQAHALNQLGRADEAVVFAERACARAEFPAARTALVIAHYQAGHIDTAVRAASALDPTAAASARDRVLFAVVLAAGFARLGRLDAARRAEAVALAEQDAVAGTRPGALVVLARALVAVADGDEDVAARLLDGIGLAAADAAALAPLSAFLAAVYVLVPETRPTWEAMELGPDFRHARAAARALVGARSGEPRAAELPPASVVVAALGIQWATELAARTDDPALADCCVRAAPTTTRMRLQALLDDDGARDGARALCKSVPVPPETTLVVRLLGPAVLERDGMVVDHPDWRRERVRSLLALLVVRGRATRGEIAAELWPDLDAEAASGNLRVTLRYLHRVLEPGREPGNAPWYARTRGDLIELTSDLLVVDAREMERLLDSALAADRAARIGDALAAFRAALGWWRGELAADLFDEWIGHERARLRARFLAGAVRAGELLVGRGEIDDALELGTKALAVEPWSEPAYRLVASAHLARGDRASTRRTLERCRAMLDDLGVDPEPETLMLWRRFDLGADPSRSPADS